MNNTKMTFSSKLRIRSKLEYCNFFTPQKKKWVFPTFIAYGIRNELDHPRLGLTVKKQFGSAHKRNRFKRRVREFFRRNQFQLKGWDYNFVPRAPRNPQLYKNSLQKDLIQWGQLAQKSASIHS